MVACVRENECNWRGWVWANARGCPGVNTVLYRAARRLRGKCEVLPVNMGKVRSIPTCARVGNRQTMAEERRPLAKYQTHVQGDTQGCPVHMVIRLTPVSEDKDQYGMSRGGEGGESAAVSSL